MHTLDHQVFQFGSFRLDLTRGCVFDGDREIELRPKSFEVLRYLVENAGRLVSKEELIGRIWPNAIVNENSLARCVSDVRQAVRDEMAEAHVQLAYVLQAVAAVKHSESPREHSSSIRISPTAVTD